MREIELQTADGLQLYGWLRDPSAAPKGVFAHVHGMGEHSRRYDHLTAYWAVRGYASAGFDLRGHGRSQGKRGHTPSYEHLMDDIAIFLARVAATWPSLPITLYGHSLGGNLVLNYVIRRKPVLARVVATAPYLRLAFDPPRWKLLVSKVLSRIAPSLTLSSGLNPRALSRDPEVVRRYETDPLVHDRISAAFFTHVHAAGAALISRASELTIPTLVMHGGADRITSAAASREFVDASAGMATLEIWEGFFHEIHNEPGWESVAARVLAGA
jgi:alpha-beta hydrolase superfamily lysophospholipase